MKNDDLRWKNNIVFLLVFSSGPTATPCRLQIYTGLKQFLLKMILSFIQLSFHKIYFLQVSKSKLFFPNSILIVLVISKVWQILGLWPRISKVFLNHQNNFFSQQVGTILVTKHHLGMCISIRGVNFQIKRNLASKRIFVSSKIFFEKPK